MAKKKIRKKRATKNKSINKTISRDKVNEQLWDSRDGGQVALMGYTYQLLYSCYLILSDMDDDSTAFHLEGIEDIDRINYEDSYQNVTHIQLKYSTNKQNASFLKGVLKNFLEVYLIDKTHCFKLIYDFAVAKGHMDNLFSHRLDKKSVSYWKGVIYDIKKDNLDWNWEGFQFENFIEKLTFEKKEKAFLANDVEKELIKAYNITTDNLTLYANGLEVCCLEKMSHRDSIKKQDLDTLILRIKDNISRGTQNPAYQWIKKINFDSPYNDTDLSYFEGKKPTPQDIARQLPVRRFNLEQEIKKAINDNRVTVIKASSGQGKTTIALQVAYDMRSEYTVYQLLWCNDAKELTNIVQYFKTRVQLGEKPFILVDNLDTQLAEWNKLAQLLQEEVSYHYKLLLTTREDDWYNYSGDLSNIRNLELIPLGLNEKEAELIYKSLKKAQKLYSSIIDWKKSWAKVADRKLLIEYVYLLTHGQMLSERIGQQINQISKEKSGGVKCEILRKVCFADICGIKLQVNQLIASLVGTTTEDYGELLRSMEREFFIHVDSTRRYIGGLHPVRSQHVVDILHEYLDIGDTALGVVKIADVSYFSKLFFNLPDFIDNKRAFYSEVVDALWNRNDLSRYVLALQGLFSGSVMQYFRKHQDIFDDAAEHSGLLFLITDLCPFTEFKEFDYKEKSLDVVQKLTPQNENIQYLSYLRDTVPKIDLRETDVYCLCKILFKGLKDHELLEITSDIDSYSNIAYWLLNLSPEFNLSSNISLQEVWENGKELTADVMSSLMYTCFCGNKEEYLKFVEKNLSMILSYLKVSTQSLRVYTDADKNEIHVEYILLASDIDKGNEESVKRLKIICRTLPIFDTYCADSITPKIDFLSGYKIPDDAHKAIPIRNLIISFHQDFASLWNKTIMSNYECNSVFEWLDHWSSVRMDITDLSIRCTKYICILLKGPPYGRKLQNLGSEIDDLRNKVNRKVLSDIRYPYEDRPFEEKPKIPEKFGDIRKNYFQSAVNFCKLFPGFVRLDSSNVRLVLINLRKMREYLKEMEEFFKTIYDKQRLSQKEQFKLCRLEEQNLQRLLMDCLYYKDHKPNQYFDKYAVKTWYKRHHRQALKDAEQSLSVLPLEYDAIFPIESYYKGILKYYPIIIQNFDINNGEKILELFYRCVPFAELDFDYLVIIFRNQWGIMQVGWKIPKENLKRLDTAINTENIAVLEQLSPSFPEEITADILKCFEHQYEIQIPRANRYEGIDKIAELLWAFSVFQRELSSEDDREYKNCVGSDLKKKIMCLLKSFDSKVTRDEYSKLNKLCNNVFNGLKFDDVRLNSFLNKVMENASD